MNYLIKLPLLFFFLAGIMGLLLRWHFYQPISEFNYPYWLHAHSHGMFLGWVFNLLSVALVVLFIQHDLWKKYLILLIIQNVLVFAMLISFPIQGYGVASIVLSTIHTAVTVIFIYFFSKETRTRKTEVTIWFARMSMLFFLLSAIGPFLVGGLAASGLGHSKWYYFSVYYYLHFQYNGVFVFGIFSMVFEWLQNKNITFSVVAVRIFGLLMVISCFLTYALSLLWAEPGWIYNIVGGVGAALQVLALFYFAKIISKITKEEWTHFSRFGRILLATAFIAFCIKVFLQLLSSHSSIAAIAYHHRNFIIAYLHLVLLGVVSCFLIAWLMDRKTVPIKGFGIALFLAGFILNEAGLIVVKNTGSLPQPIVLFVGSIFLVTGIFSFLIDTLKED